MLSAFNVAVILALFHAIFHEIRTITDLDMLKVRHMVAYTFALLRKQKKIDFMDVAEVGISTTQ